MSRSLLVKMLQDASSRTEPSMCSFLTFKYDFIVGLINDLCLRPLADHGEMARVKEVFAVFKDFSLWREKVLSEDKSWFAFNLRECVRNVVSLMMDLMIGVHDDILLDVVLSNVEAAHATRIHDNRIKDITRPILQPWAEQVKK